MLPLWAIAIAAFADMVDLPSPGFAEETAKIFFSEVARAKFTFVLIDL